MSEKECPVLKEKEAVRYHHQVLQQPNWKEGILLTTERNTIDPDY